MNHLITMLVMGFASVAMANSNLSKVISVDMSTVQSQKVSEKKSGNFTKFSVAGIENSKEVGAPALPVQSWLLKGNPSDIQVQMNVMKEQTLKNVRPYPVQAQDCRCETQEKKGFQFDAQVYEQKRSAYTLNYLGTFRGTPITRLDVNMASYDSATNSVTVRSQVQVSANVAEFSLERGEYKDYLIVSPENLVEGTTDFVNWKKSQGYNVHVKVLATAVTDINALAGDIKNYYTNDGVDFVIMVGDSTAIPMHKVSTSGSGSTPTDLKYFTMDGPTDYIPEMFASRIPALTADQVRAQLAKSIEFEQRSFADNSGMKRVIGIASNEGSNPSDDAYVKATNAKFKEVLGVDVLHLHQNDSVNSNPVTLNKAFDAGALWLTYLGHGSGSSWPSMNKSYSTSHIAQINNKNVVKPVIIDVACMNGRVAAGYLGTTFSKVDGDHAGALAYYGGTVNISWHPPAVMARGIAFEHMDKKFKHLGEALLAGQMYLAANWTNTNDVVDNMEWYHLQGDPGLNIEFQ